MPRFRLLAALVIVGLTVGCKAQTSASSSPGQTSNLDRQIEVQVRSQYDLPPDVNVSLGARSPSQFSGYQKLPVILSKGAKSQTLEFLISDDNTKLLRMETMDLTKNPADAIDIAGRPIRGNPNAKVTIINFDDLECPYCARMHQELFPETLDHYKGLVRFVYKNDPLTELHPWAMHAAVDADCLAAQNGSVYWTYVDYLHGHGEEITGQNNDPQKSFAALDRVARQEATLGKLDSAKLDACLAKQDETQVKASLKEADALGLEGTPELFVDGERINGAVPKEQLWASIDRALRAHGEQPPPEPAPEAPQPAGSAGK